jgi:hypothetical protein
MCAGEVSPKFFRLAHYLEELLIQRCTQRRVFSSPIVCLCLLSGAVAVATAQTPAPKPAPVTPAQPAANGPLPEYIEEFFLSEAVRSEDRNELQLTLDGMAFKGRGSAMDGKSAGFDMEYGITSRLQFGCEGPYGIQSTPTSETPVSWSTADLSLLYQFIRGNHPFALSGVMGFNAPLTSRGELSYEPEILIAKAFGTLQIHTSVIPELGGGETSLEYNVAAVHPFVHHWVPTLEFNGRRNAGVNAFYVTPGMYKRLPHRFEMGAGVPAGMGRYSSPFGVVFKMTLELGGDGDD